ncbi:hypothetical protein [Catellatospora sp. TT07R-123]|uniref:hypothetical protein n=1 Tax=Catellatospora sp. TT07R-123 TaxID=2733863 RepID=UPI001BB303EB|nr:hypothetical protein [Catellatospora sp. TT07R-123]
MGVGATLQWSDIARNPREVAAAVERDGEARLERRGEGAAFVLMTAARAAATRAGVRIAERLLRNSLVHAKRAGDLDSLLLDSFPWLQFIPQEYRPEFAAEFVATFEACSDLEVWAPMERLMREWRATAAIYADPELAARLRGPFDDDLGVALPPEVVIDDAGRAQ